MGPIDSVKVQLSAVLGTVRLPINQILRMGRGAVIELDASEDDSVEIRANNIPIAFGEVTVQNDKIAVTISKILKAAARRSAAARTLVSE
jgi:flagellar motor switch protein FliN/FliY